MRDNKRNSENVVNSSDAIGWKRYHSNKNFLFPQKNIAGPTNFYYQNVQQLDNATLAIAAIQKYHAENIHEPVVILLENSDQVEQLYCNLKENLGNRKVLRVPLTETLDNEEEIRNFIIKPEGILITYSHAFNGAEARNIIIFQESHTNEVLRNLVLRAVSFAIIICNDKIEDAVKSVPGFTEDTNLHKYIAKFNKARVGKEIKNPKEITSGGIEPELGKFLI